MQKPRPEKYKDSSRNRLVHGTAADKAYQAAGMVCAETRGKEGAGGREDRIMAVYCCSCFEIAVLCISPDTRAADGVHCRVAIGKDAVIQPLDSQLRALHSSLKKTTGGAPQLTTRPSETLASVRTKLFYEERKAVLIFSLSEHVSPLFLQFVLAHRWSSQETLFFACSASTRITTSNERKQK